MATFKDSFSDLERHRKTLEDHVEKLRKSLHDWRMWEIDYEALKEEVEALPNPAPPKDIIAVHQGWDGMALSQQEAAEIIYNKSGNPQSSDKIVQLLSRRIDYVEQNVATLERQLESAENRLAAASVIEHPEAVDEDGLPITEIIEELDDDDGVVSFQLRSAGDAQPQLLEALDKVGGLDVSTGDTSRSSAQPATNADVEMTDADDTPSEPAPKKGVSFADDTKPGHDVNAPSAPIAGTSSLQIRRLEEIMDTAKDNDQMDLSTAVIPADESAEDAALRREMLEYSMSHIGPVVAELTLEEGDYDEELDDDYEYSEEEEDEEEFEEDDDEDDVVDHLGRSRYSVITDDYRERMKALEKKLGVSSYFTTNDEMLDALNEEAQVTNEEILDALHEEMDVTNAEMMEEDAQVQDHGIGRISVAKPATTSTADVDVLEVTAVKPSSEREEVRFASVLDIAPEDSGPVFDPVHGQVRTAADHEADPLSDVVERSTSANSNAATPAVSAEPPTKKRLSRFKQARTTPFETTQSRLPTGPHEAPTRFLDQPLPFRPAPTGPDGQTLANQVIERDTVPGSAVEPDLMDPALLHREVEEEYHKKRNKMMGQNGAFAGRTDVGEEEEEEAQPKRVSRFKAARMGN